MGNSLIDMAGKTFGNWKILNSQRRLSDNKLCWLCECQCESKTKFLFPGDMFRRNRVSPSCQKCRPKHQAPIFSPITKIPINSKFGKWTVIKRVSPPEYIKKKCKPIYVLCKCDCGKEKAVTLSSIKNGDSKKCKQCWRKKNHGYISIKRPDHANSTKGGWILEHIFIMSNYIGRPIKKGETIHHKNGIKDDNRIENLELWASNHHKGQRISDLIDHAHYILHRYSDYINPSEQQSDYQI